ncbi:UNVERIFIED_CONTAM: hypothetical protein Sradi_3169200 [Sesamum radiatum]|uniref:Reverse transcriptase Ty1/copia-type domain-containing protein n=1 Tax=Sesamum radiatum TaxID=300843 RepID=A0AAW2REK8_SESRA
MTFKKTMSDIDSRKWLEAMRSEIDSIYSNKVWTLVDPPKRVRPIGWKWVYKRELRVNGKVMIFMALSVVKGYTQRNHVDFEITYSSLTMAISRILLVSPVV